MLFRSGNNFLKLTGYIKGSLSTNILYIRFNNDSGGNYYTQRLSAATSTVTAAQLTGQAQIAVYTGVSGSIFAPIEIFIQNDSSGQQKLDGFVSQIMKTISVCSRLDGQIHPQK